MQPIVIAAGGTGGHFFPAEALAATLVARGHRVALMTDARSAGMTSDVFAGRERFVLAGAGLSGRGLRAVSAAAKLSRGVLQARTILARLDAAALVGFGGYPSVAPVLASRLLHRRPRVILHEQNAVLGRANRALARFADIVALSFPVTQHAPTHARLTGNPVRPDIVPSPIDPDGLRLLVLGGSLGARVLSDVVPAAVALLGIPVRVTQQCRAEDLPRVRDAYASHGIAADLAPFFSDVAARLAEANLVVARAGASTVAELAAVGRPAILVPLPHAIDDHQTANARALEAAGGAWVIPQPKFTPAALAACIAAALPELTQAAHAAASLADADAAGALADLVERAITEPAT